MARRKPYSEPDLFTPPEERVTSAGRPFEETHSKQVKKNAEELTRARNSREAMRETIKLRKLTHPAEAGFLSQLEARLRQNDEAPKPKK